MITIIAILACLGGGAIAAALMAVYLLTMISFLGWVADLVLVKILRRTPIQISEEEEVI